MDHGRIAPHSLLGAYWPRLAPRRGGCSSRSSGVGARHRGGAAIFLELFINLLFGLLFALCARERVRAGGAFAAPAFWLVVMFAGFISLPAALYFYLAHPAWGWLYLLDPAAVPAAMSIPVIVVVVGGLFGAWFAGGALVRSGRERVLLLGLGVTAVAFVVLAVALSGRVGAYGSYEVFQAGEARGLLEVKLGYVLIALLLGLGAAGVYVAIELLRDGRQARALHVPRSRTGPVSVNPAG